MRAVSLTCSNTEIVHYLGLDDLLVGVDDHSDYPEDLVASLPRVGPDLGIDVERVKQLEPDMVLASLTVPGHEKVVKAIDRAGLPFVAPAPQSVDDIARDIRDVARVLGHQNAGECLAEDFERRLSAYRERMAAPINSKPAVTSPKVLVQWWPKPVIAPGALSWVQGLLDRCGATNVIAEDVESRPLEDDEVLALAPDIIVVSWCGVEPAKVRPDVVRTNPVLAQTPAVRNNRVVCVPEAWLGRPSPRLLWGMWALCQLVEAARRDVPTPEVFRTPTAVAAELARAGKWPPQPSGD